MTPADEQRLVERCRAGDDEAFRELVDEHKTLVFALLARSVDDRARMEDLAQDVFLRVHRGLPYFRGEARLSTWIYRIVANLIAEERGARGPVVLSLDDERPAGVGIEPVALDRAYNAIELSDRLSKALAQLPAHYRLLINGHYLQGLKYEELAESAGLPLGTVKTHLHRAKRLLRKALEDEQQSP
jgi:RNA polymerase sigma-70 factor (ECF subfamily)